MHRNETKPVDNREITNRQKPKQQDNVQANLESVQCRVFQICKVFDYQYCKSRSRDPFPTPLT